MKQRSDREEAFVFRHFDGKRFDPEAGFARFRQRMGISVRAGRHPGSVFRRLVIPAAAAMLVLAVGTGVYFHQRNAWTEYRAYDVAQTFSLKDATQVTLAPGATLRYQPKRASRTVWQTGKVLYSVTRNAADPFEVLSDGGYIRVLGTVFQLDAGRSEASCLSGKVLFAAAQDPEPGSWQVILTAGQRAALGDAAPSAALNPAVWATGRFEYNAAPLSAVLEELSAWYGVRLSAGGPLSSSSAQVDPRLTATFEASSLDEILPLIEAALDVRVIVLDK